MKKILLTGGAGFIGHHLIEKILKTTDWNIVILDRLDYSGNLNRINEVVTDEYRKRVTVVYHDLRAELNAQIRSMIGDINIVLHLAAGSHVDRSIIYPMEFVQDNVIGTVNILEYARNYCPNLEKFVYFSTDEIFGPAPIGTAYKEYDRYNSTNPYSASKAAGEEFCVAYENTFKMPIVVTHTMNAFGIRQDPEKFIPKTIQTLRDDQLVTVHADPSCTVPGSRMYIHAEDVAEGILFILDIKDYKTKLCPKFNLVGPQEVDNLTLAKLIAEIMDKDLNYEMTDFHTSRPGHDLRYALDGSLLKSFGWEPKRKLTENLEDVVHWTLNNNRWLRK